MKKAFMVLLAVAEELAELAKSNMPKIRNGEKIDREWFQNGVYYRETSYDGEIFRASFDFRQRKSFVCRADY